MINWPADTHQWLLAVAALGLTLLVFFSARWLFRRCGEQPLLHPVLIAMLVLMGVLLITGVSYEDYWLGGQWIHFFLGPATVALAWPLYQHLSLVRSLLWPILISVLAGLLFGSVCVVLLAGWLGADQLVQWSLAPRSVTTPVAIVVAEQIGGIPALTAGFVIITGVVGAMLGGVVFTYAGIRDQRVKGIAMGVSAHGVGTARALQIHPVMGAFSGLAMALSALLMAFVLPPWLQLLGML
ncbi:LrgB family protein [Marinicella sediminis]|uniref:LrgB family protein n=1 Tax=Marinicella sediminis TaxID=1792834 RepID=A0ABV7JGU0_9GAMM|nr:LrgB family protein [Marinicella sediminis]